MGMRHLRKPKKFNFVRMSLAGALLLACQGVPAHAEDVVKDICFTYSKQITNPTENRGGGFLNEGKYTPCILLNPS